MAKWVLDASALLALLNEEPGAELVQTHLPDAVMSCVNMSEVATVLEQNGIAAAEAKEICQDLIHELIPFDAEQAFLAANLRKSTKSLGLSLGDRACLALAKKRKLPVLTADRAWVKLSLGLEIHLAR